VDEVDRVDKVKKLEGHLSMAEHRGKVGFWVISSVGLSEGIDLFSNPAYSASARLSHDGSLTSHVPGAWSETKSLPEWLCLRNTL